MKINWKKALGKVHLSFVIFLFVTGSGLLLVGVPIVAYDKYVIRRAKECAKLESEKLGVKYFTADEYRKVVEPKIEVGQIEATCNLYSIRLNYENKYEAVSRDVIWDNDPNYRNLAFSIGFFYVLTTILVLGKKWIIWVVKE